MERIISSVLCVWLAVALSNRVDGDTTAVAIERLEPAKGVCSFLEKGDLCFADIESWYFEPSETDECFNSTVDKCGGKGNSFQSKEECEEKCLGQSDEGHGHDHGHGEDHDHDHDEDHLDHHDNEEEYPDYDYRPVRPGGWDPGHCWGHCRNHCPGGYRRCHSCQCNYYTRPRCPIPHCPNHCNNEYWHGGDGCQQCGCRGHCTGYGCQGSNMCAGVHCPTVCPRPGYSSLHHCCNCRGNHISRPPCNGHCRNHCQYGHLYHPYQRCHSCECRRQPYLPRPILDPIYRPADPCPYQSCGLNCPQGRMKSEDGCPLCQCDNPHSNPHPYHDELKDCSHQPCRKDCAFGCYVNQASCETRVCLPSSRVLHRGHQFRQAGEQCPNIRATCRLHCPHGYVVDGIGCETCQCVESRGSVCPPSKDCGKNCRNGFYKHKDENGCETCVCRKWNEDKLQYQYE